LIVVPQTSWDPDQYLMFEQERARAFHDLVAQVSDLRPGTIADLGCGPGHLTATLADRWPEASVTGVDSSSDMIETARELARAGRLTFVSSRIEDWRPEQPVDLIVSNAALQWVPSHVDLLPVWLADYVNPGGAVAFQVPASGGSAASVAIRTVAASPEWAPRLGAIALGRGPRSAGSPVLTPDAYVELLAGLGYQVDGWETTYLHVLPGDDPVLEWFAGTGLRPYLDVLDGDTQAVASFRRDVARALRESYPPQPYGTILPFRRIFVVARRPGSVPRR
jgi:trans-aconitate 2-methyltransferase